MFVPRGDCSSFHSKEQSSVLSAMIRSWVGEGTAGRFVPFLGNCKVLGGPSPRGLANEGENMATHT